VLIIELVEGIYERIVCIQALYDQTWKRHFANVACCNLHPESERTTSFIPVLKEAWFTRRSRLDATTNRIYILVVMIKRRTHLMDITFGFVSTLGHPRNNILTFARALNQM
jgi:hypothetical protein